MSSSNHYLPSQESKRVPWLSNFAEKLAFYAAKYGISAADVETTAKNAKAYAAWVDYANKVSDYVKAVNAFKADLANGEVKPIAPPPPIATPAMPPVTTSGIFRLVSIIVFGIKKSLSYTMADGIDLGIEVLKSVTMNVASIKPVFTIRITTAGFPEIVWTKGDFDGIEIQIFRNNAWVFLASDSTPNYIDHSPLPEVGKSEVRLYRIIYTIKDEMIGLYSDPVEIAVKGE